MKTALLCISLIFTSIVCIGQVKVACIGNSITAAGYPEELNSLLGKAWEIKNFGVSGATMLRKGDIPYHKTVSYKKVKEFNPEVIIIKLGTNDSKPHNWKYGNDYYNEYTIMIHELKSLPTKPMVILCYPVPAFNRGWSINDTVIRNEIIPRIKSVAHDNNVRVIDLYKPLSRHPEFFPDGIHPNKAGSKEIARLVAISLKKWERKIYRRKTDSSLFSSNSHHYENDWEIRHYDNWLCSGSCGANEGCYIFNRFEYSW